jgi:hypothetical protein
MKLGDVLDPQFKSGLSKLISGDIPMKALMKLEGILDQVNGELAKYDKVRKAALLRHAEVKEDGTVLAGENGQAIFKSESDAKTFFEQSEELADTEVEIGSMKLSELGDLEKSGVKMNVDEYKKLKASILEV